MEKEQKEDKCGRGKYVVYLNSLLNKDCSIVKIEDSEFEMFDRKRKENFTELLRYDDNTLEQCKQNAIKSIMRKETPILPSFENAEKSNKNEKTNRNDKLIEYLSHSSVSIGIEAENGMILTMVGHLCSYLKPKLKECILLGKCTFTVTKDNFIRQKGYHCITCFLTDENSSICESCANICHKHHILVSLPKDAAATKTHMYCDCSQFKCECL